MIDAGIVDPAGGVLDVCGAAIPQLTAPMPPAPQPNAAIANTIASPQPPAPNSNVAKRFVLIAPPSTESSAGCSSQSTPARRCAPRQT